MKRNLRRLLSMFIILLSITVMSGPLSQPVFADDTTNKVTIVHTNDMHGRLNQKSGDYTLFSLLDYYVKNNNVDFLLDAGDAIQGMPISNLNKGQKILEVMNDIGYDAMTIGNHEFDFGYDNIVKLEKTKLVPMVSNNVVKDGSSVFDRHTIVDNGTFKAGIIGVTTPETSTKTHPNNVDRVTFADPLTEVKKDIDVLKVEPDINIIIVLAHLGVDGETPVAWRGNNLAAELAKLGLEIPILVIDGHSHTEYPTGEFHGDKVLYVQTGEYLNNIGHVEIDLDDFSKSTAKLVATSSVVPTGDHPKILPAEEVAKNDFEETGKELIFDGLEYILSSHRDIVRRREAALGNLITDAMMSYGQGFSQKPDLAVINGGGIRADLNPPTITVGDVIAVLPFGNMYSSIEVTGQQILDMFEFSYSTDSDVSDEGELVLGQAGGFLQVSGVKVIFNSAKPAGSRIEGIWFERDNGLEALDLTKSYVLATNDFLAVGGDGYTMLGGVRIEGNGLEEVFREFLEDHGDTLDWSLYEDQTPRTRLFQIDVDAETMTALEEAIENAKALIEDSDDIPVELINVLQAAINKAEGYLLVVEDYTLEDHLLNIDAVLAAMEAIEDYEAPVVPVEPTEPEDKDELPPTGVSSVFNPGFALIGLGLVTTAVAKKRRKED